MSFNSFEFLVFFPLVVAVYFALPARYHWIFLLGASYFFYMSWKPQYALVLLGSTLVVYVAGWQIGRTTNPGRRKAWLALSLLLNLGLLFSFKYANFANESVRQLLSRANILYAVPAVEVLLPLGISFYTFQALSYVIDVYRGRQAPEKHPGIFALYVSFFPQLVAGPITRAAHLLPQFHQAHGFDEQRVTAGLLRMAWGFYKKVVIADRLALYVGSVYDRPAEYTGLPLIVATYLFVWQLYCDFSGYADIAIGAAQVLGFDLQENFRRPLFARSVGEFWQRWHISLTAWFRDYLYIPLARRRRFRAPPVLDLVILFVIIGLWHGANWTFVAFGALQGFYMVFDVWTRGPRLRLSRRFGLDRHPRLLAAVQLLVTFHLLVLSVIFFRANSLAEAFYIVRHLFVSSQSATLFNAALTRYEFALAILAIVILTGVEVLQERGVSRTVLSRQPVWIRWPAYYALLFGILMFGQFGRAEFIYFQF